MKKRDYLLMGLSLAALLVGLESAYAGTAGNLDNTFGANGVTAVTAAGVNGIVNSILLQNDGKILVYVGGAAVLRFTTNGVLDTAFGSNGVAMLSTSIGGSLALQTNGQIVIGGIVTPSGGGAELGVMRLNPNGTSDASFGSGGLGVVSLGNRAPNTGSAVLLQPDGDIVVCSTLISVGRGQPYQTTLARFNSASGLDTTFGNQGLSIQTGVNGCSSLALLSNGDYLVVNTVAVAEFSPTGVARPTVTGGTIVAASQSSAAFLPSIFDTNGDYLFGSELFVGEESRGHNSSGEVQRFTQTGTQVFNTTFHYVGAGGSGIEAIVLGVAVQANGNVVAVGDQTTFSRSGNVTVYGLARLTASGSLDTTFGNGGTVVNNIPATSAVAIQSDGNIVTAGFGASNGALTIARYLGH
jgi:uncharacterized delta-60 repeat protein